MIRCLFLSLVMFAMLAMPARAALPDPVAFGWAIERGDIQKVKGWLDEGLDPEFQASQIGTGLMVAAWHGNIEMMQLFVERGANPRRANKNGEQPLQLAAWNGHTAAVKWLLERGAPLNREGNYWGALHYAVFNGHTELAKYLIERGAQINARSPNGSTPLILAAREGREDLAKVLLESGADTRAKNDWGDTPLTMAMRYDHYRLGKMISTPEEFDIAVKAPKESFGDASRSTAAPNEIERLLKEIQIAEMEGKPSDELRKQLQAAVDAFRRSAYARKAARTTMPAPPPKSLVITARRGKQGSEKVEILIDGRPASPPPRAQAAGSEAQRIQTRIADLMREIRLADAQGRPADDLRQQLFEAIEASKRYQ